MNKYLYEITRTPAPQKARIIVCADSMQEAETAINKAIEDNEIRWRTNSTKKQDYKFVPDCCDDNGTFLEDDYSSRGLQIINPDGTSKFTTEELQELTEIMHWNEINIDQAYITVLPEENTAITAIRANQSADKVYCCLKSGKKVLIPEKSIRKVQKS